MDEWEKDTISFIDAFCVIAIIAAIIYFGVSFLIFLFH